MQNPPHNPLGGLDPADLLKQGAAEDTFMDGRPSSFNPPSIEELATLFPQFEILELIGKGGMGAVYKVRQKELDRIVALKILPPAIGQSPAFSSRFTREAKALAKLNHPGIVTLHEFGQQDGLYFILMEFVDGVNLAQLMKTGRISPREALAIVPQICDALQFAHDQGIVHRDIKPENILLDRLGRVKVADFGIAKVIAAVCEDPIRSGDIPVPGDATIAGKIIGTPAYMAPEQIDHPAEVDHRADIYALGVVFYQMLTGELPGRELQAPSRKVHIDVRLDEIVMQALEKNPELRYQTAGEMRTRVDAVTYHTPKAGAIAGNTVVMPITELRFSRAAIWGATWAPLLFIVFVMEFSVREAATGEYHGPAWWQTLLAFTLLPLGLAAPFGTTILGWVSVTQIRRSEGKLCGLGLAVFDGLLFPLLALTGLIGWFWHWVFDDLIRTPIIEGRHQLSTLQQLLATNTTTLTVLATLMTSLIVGIIIIHRIWREVNRPFRGEESRGAPVAPRPVNRTALAFGFGSMIFGIFGVQMWLNLSKTRDQASNRATAAAQTIEKSAVDKLTKLPAANAANELWIFGPVIERVLLLNHSNLTDCLDMDTNRLISLAADNPRPAALFPPSGLTIRIDSPDNQPMIMGSDGTVVQPLHREQWEAMTAEDARSSMIDFIGPDDTIAVSGEGELPRTYIFKTKTPRIGLLQITGFTENPRGVKIRYKLVQVFNEPPKLRRLDWQDQVEACAGDAWLPSGEIEASNDWMPPINGVMMNGPGQDADGHAFIQITRDSSQDTGGEQFDFVAITKEGRRLERTGYGTSSSGKVTIERFPFDTPLAQVKSFECRKRPVHQITWPVVLKESPNTSGKMKIDFDRAGDSMQKLAFAPGTSIEHAVVSEAQAWLVTVDRGGYPKSHELASAFFQKAMTSEKWDEALTLFRKPLGEVKSRKLLTAELAKSLPGAPDGDYFVMQFDTSFTAKEKAVETVTFMSEKDGTWKAAGYFIK